MFIRCRRQMRHEARPDRCLCHCDECIRPQKLIDHREERSRARARIQTKSNYRWEKSICNKIKLIDVDDDDDDEYICMHAKYAAVRHLPARESSMLDGSPFCRQFIRFDVI